MSEKTKFRILVVEDNVITAKHIAATLKNFGWEVTAVCNKVASALQALRNERPDLAILDINLNQDIDGVELASILKLDHALPFIFLTSYSDQATLNRIMRVNPAGYLQKPFNPLELKSMVELAIFKSSHAPVPETNVPKPDPGPLEGFLFVRNNRKIDKVAIPSIRLIESSGRYTYLYFEDKKKISSTPLKDLKAKLDDKRFVQVHKSYLVNLAFVETLSLTSLRISGKEIPIGKQYRDGLMDLLDIV